MKATEPSLYAVLGVRRNAKQSTIRKAYREKAKAAHPDGGGSSEAFAKLKHAQDVLTDSRRREEYDRTGNAASVPPDNSMAEAMAVLSTLITSAANKCIETGTPPTGIDLIDVITRTISAEKKAVEGLRTTAAKTLDVVRKMAGRFSRKQGQDGENAFEPMLSAIAANIEVQVKNFDHRLGTLDRALSISEQYVYEWTKPEPAAIRTSVYYGPIFRTGTSSTTT